MNRSLANVLFGGFGVEDSVAKPADDVYAGKVSSASVEEAAMVLEGARKLVIVPGRRRQAGRSRAEWRPQGVCVSRRLPC